ncbi:ABC transporter related protein [Thermanaeromonas toyohensis ToBE]|uniref:ABC transporter related protein n=1 Tax=Thermanaeromonas toyohensis ToBE TaxID=698762 RepID=A0A1W1VSX1_9FIRM|nr:ABC transporter related protein [Thermanaeromonas toyohensis ToBE]
MVLDKLIGIAGGPQGKGSRTLRRTLYGGLRPL